MESQIKKLKSVTRLLFFILKKGKKRLLLGLNLNFERAKIVGKSLIKELVSNHRSGDAFMNSAAAGAFNCPHPPLEEYEFSCSNTPIHHDLFLHLHHLIGGKRGKSKHQAQQYDSCQKEMEAMFLNDAVGASPGFRFGPLRVTDSPFPISGGGGDSHVDEKAEEFIKKFYSQLRRQPPTDV